MTFQALYDLYLEDMEKYIEGTPQIAKVPFLPVETNVAQGSVITGIKIRTRS